MKNIRTLNITIAVQVKSDPDDQELMLEDLLAKIQEDIEEGILSFNVEIDENEEDTE